VDNLVRAMAPIAFTLRNALADRVRSGHSQVHVICYEADGSLAKDYAGASLGLIPGPCWHWFHVGFMLEKWQWLNSSKENVPIHVPNTFQRTWLIIDVEIELSCQELIGLLRKAWNTELERDLCTNLGLIVRNRSGFRIWYFRVGPDSSRFILLRGGDTIDFDRVEMTAELTRRHAQLYLALTT
jgi:hypothetical protein